MREAHKRPPIRWQIDQKKGLRMKSSRLGPEWFSCWSPCLPVRSQVFVFVRKPNHELSLRGWWFSASRLPASAASASLFTAVMHIHASLMLLWFWDLSHVKPRRRVWLWYSQASPLALWYHLKSTQPTWLAFSKTICKYLPGYLV